MPRTIDHQRRDRLVDLVATDLVDNGLAGASLDRLAAAAHTSARMLVHHFGSRQALIGRALECARRRQIAAAQEALPASSDFVSRLATAWPWFASAQTRRYFKLFSQVASAELSEGAATVRGGMATEWIDLFQAGFAAAGYSRSEATTQATIVAAQLRGLFLDLDATDDTRRIGRAYKHFVGLIQSDAPPSGR